MINYTPEFVALREAVDKLKQQLKNAQILLQKSCPHIHLNGQTAFLKGHFTSYRECDLCGMSEYYLGREKEAWDKGELC